MYSIYVCQIECIFKQTVDTMYMVIVNTNWVSLLVIRFRSGSYSLHSKFIDGPIGFYFHPEVITRYGLGGMVVSW